MGEMVPEGGMTITTTTTSVAPPPKEHPDARPHDDFKDSDWHLALGAVTDVPLDVGGRVALETPGRFRLSTEVGTMPAAYSNAMNGALRGLNVYDQSVGNLISQSFDSTIVWRNHVGVRPFARTGFYLEGGYTMVHMSASIDGATLGQAVGVGSVLSGTNYAMGTTLHMLDAELGWEFPLVDGFRLRTAIGGVFTMQAKTSLTATGVPEQAETAVSSLSGQVDHLFEKYGFMPLLSVGLDYRIF